MRMKEFFFIFRGFIEYAFLLLIQAVTMSYVLEELGISIQNFISGIPTDNITIYTFRSVAQEHPIYYLALLDLLLLVLISWEYWEKYKNCKKEW